MRARVASCLAMVCLATACGEAPTYVLLKVPDPADGGVILPDGSIPRRDGGAIDTGIQDAAPPHDRQLTEYRLLGETPIENLVMNPQLDLHTTLSLFGFAGFFRRYHWPSTPAGMPVLEASAGEGAIIPVQSRQLLLDASIWIGRRAQAPGIVGVMLTGIGRDGSMRSASLMRDTASRVELDEIVWERFAGRISEAFLGQVQMVVDNSSGGSALFATGPIVVPAESGVRGPSFPAIPVRPIDEGLREKLEEAFARAAEQARRSIADRRMGLPR